MTSVILTADIEGVRRCVPGISMTGQPLKYWENSSALRVALIRMTFRSGRLGSMSLRYIIRKSLQTGNINLLKCNGFYEVTLICYHANKLTFHKISHHTMNSFINVGTNLSGFCFE